MIYRNLSRANKIKKTHFPEVTKINDLQVDNLKAESRGAPTNQIVIF